MKYNSLNPTNNNFPASNPSSEGNQPQATEGCEKTSSLSDANKIKVQFCLVLALTEVAYKLGHRYLQQYEIFQKDINSKQAEAIDTLMHRAEAMPIQLLKDKAYQAIALKQHLDFYLRNLAIGKISNPIKRLETALEMFKIVQKSFTQESYYRILQDLLPQEWKINGDSQEIDPSNPLSLNDFGHEALRGLDLNLHTSQIQFLSEEELGTVLAKLGVCHQNIFNKDQCPEALSQFLSIVQSPCVQIDAVSNKVLQLVTKIQKQSKFVPANMFEQVPQVYSLLIKNSYFLPIIRLLILKTMGECEAKKQLAEYLLTDPSSPVVLELNIFKSSIEETAIATTYLDCIPFLQDDYKIDCLLETVYKLPIFNHTPQFYLFLLGLKESEIAKQLIQRTENKEIVPNCPESPEIIQGKYKALNTAKIWYQMGVRNLGEANFRLAYPT